MSTNYWKNKVCLVTGGSTGLGRALAAGWSSRGAHVVLAARGQQQLEQTASELGRQANHQWVNEVVPIAADVTRQADVERMLARIVDQFGQLDLLCNCAGRSERRAILETTADDFEHLMEINLLATVRMTRAAAGMLLDRGGHLVNIGSLAGKVATRFMGAYPASKFALAAYSQQLRLELGPRGLHVLLVCPGPITRNEEGPNEQGLHSERGPRYDNPSLPAEANKPGAGAKVRTIDPVFLADKIVRSCQKRQSELIVPGKARLLFALAQLSPRLGDWMLQRWTS